MQKTINTKLAICAVTIAIGSFAATSSNAAAFLQFDPTLNEVTVGEMFEVDVRYNFFDAGYGAQDLAAFDIDVTFDTDMLSFNSYSLTDNLGSLSAGDADDWSYGHDGHGTVNLAELSYLYDFSFQSDNFVLATLSFTALEIGQSSLDFTYIDLSDSWGDSIAYPVFGGPATVSAAPVPEPATMVLFGTGLLGLIAMRRNRKNNSNE
jgi:hypothetical protein